MKNNIEISRDNETRTESQIENLIFTVRGVQVILDRDLARLYNMETKRINQQVKRNPIKFPERYVFQLTVEEIESSRSLCATLNADDASMRSQNATIKTARGKNIKYLPYAFTEQGASMLATVIKGEVAAHITLRIMDAFFAMRDYLRSNAPMLQRLANLEQNLIQTNNILLTTLDNDRVTEHQLQVLKSSQQELKQQVDKVQYALASFQKAQPAPRMGIYFDGRTFDAFQLVQQLVRKASQRIVLIDSYVNDDVLARLSDRKAGVTCDIYMQSGRAYNAIIPAVEAYNLQYPSELINLHSFNLAHDRFLIIDDEVYHFGASIKDLGKRWFGVNLITEITADELIARL